MADNGSAIFESGILSCGLRRNFRERSYFLERSEKCGRGDENFLVQAQLFAVVFSLCGGVAVAVYSSLLQTKHHLPFFVRQVTQVKYEF